MHWSARLAPRLALTLALAACNGDDTSSTDATSESAGTSSTGDATTSASTTTASSDTGTTSAGTGTGTSAGTTSGESTSTTDPTTGTTGVATQDPTGGVCGDNTVDAGEECDDGNMDDTDACVAGCVQATCGDGFVQAGVEACDDGNQVDDDACPNNCAAPGCGDGIVQAGEECDDGNMNDADACTNQCKIAACGDGKVQDGEECDDGNQVDDDACSNACVTATCSDKAKNGGESDVDCGGPCSPCANGDTCKANADCQSMSCEAGVCTSGLQLPACQDQAVDAVMLHQQVISMKCGMTCHLGNFASGGLNVKDAAALKANTVNVKSSSALDRVEPGVVDQSYLVYKILGQQLKAPGGGGSSMPIGGTLTDAQKCMVINWVKGGAK